MQRTTFDPTVAMTYPLAQGHVLQEDGTIGVYHQFADHTAHYPALTGLFLPPPIESAKNSP
jgi:hypothetical protein